MKKAGKLFSPPSRAHSALNAPNGDSWSALFITVPRHLSAYTHPALTLKLPPALPPQKQLFDHYGNKANHKKQKNHAKKFLKHHIFFL
jgi:hypothetical protein